MRGGCQIHGFSVVKLSCVGGGAGYRDLPCVALGRSRSLTSTGGSPNPKQKAASATAQPEVPSSHPQTSTLAKGSLAQEHQNSRKDLEPLQIQTPPQALLKPLWKHLCQGKPWPKRASARWRMRWLSWNWRSPNPRPVRGGSGCILQFRPELESCQADHHSH